MARLISIASGNFTSSSTWAVADTASSTNSSANNTALTTSYVSSSNFTTGAITIDAILVRVASRAASPTGTMSVELYNATAGASVAGTEVTINVSDIVEGESAADGGCSWVCFKFAAPVTLAAATNYNVRAKTSSSSQVNLYRNATAGNWSRFLRTTTTAAPAAGDDILVIGEFTAAATSTTFTVTVDNTATTTFGFFYVCLKGVCQFGTSASTNYYLKHGTLAVFAGGNMDVGTGLPSTSTITINCASTSAAEFGLNLFGTFTAVGTYKNMRSNMTADKSATNTVIAVADTTGWEATDELAFPSTTRTASQSEKKTISTVDSSTQVTLTAGLTNAHLGSGDTVCEVMNLSRNVLISGTSTSNTGFVIARTKGINTFENVEFQFLGSSSVPAIEVKTTTGTFSMEECVLHDCTNATTIGISVTSTSGSNISIINTGVYSVTNNGVNIAATTGVNTFDNIYCIGCGGDGFFSSDADCLFSNIKCAGNTGVGIYFNDSAATFLDLDQFTSHSNGSYGLRVTNIYTGNYSNGSIWRNNTHGMYVSSVFNPNLVFDTINLFGNNSTNINLINTSDSCGSVVFKNITMNGGTTLVTAIGLALNDATSCYYFENCSFGATSDHSSGSINCATSTAPNVYLYNTTFGDPTEMFNQSNISKVYNTVGVVSVNHNGVAGAQKSWSRMGTITTDTTIYHTASPAIRLTPISASLKLPFAYKIIPVKSGETVTVSVWVRKSEAADGFAYNGAQPRLMLRKNLETGITSDTVLDTASAAAGTWEELTATTSAASADGAFEFYVDCDGTVGWIDVDDFTTTYVLDSSDMKYWNYGRPAIDGPETGGGGAGGSFCGGG